MRAGVFVTGTDTGIGKTVVSACLVRRWGAEYWKPVQTGLADDPGDSLTVAALSGAPASRIHAPRHAFQAPLSPEAAAAAEGATLALADFTLPPTAGPIVVEGAGGVLVPLGGGALMVDLMVRLGLPVLLVARTALGTINHTLLSLEALRARGLTIWGVVMVGPDGLANAEAITRIGRVAILARLAPLPALTPAAISAAAHALPAAPPPPALTPPALTPPALAPSALAPTALAPTALTPSALTPPAPHKPVEAHFEAVYSEANKPVAVGPVTVQPALPQPDAAQPEAITCQARQGDTAATGMLTA